ncbi:hypothetical protein B0H16DRAFT_1896903 [Mycena metata]|uniref:Uncharacterized protein n=1 Tax=Mycena metata TaxID=1033252 RepID=A0AAD7HHT4_9AGAR|nr:hypothetical protein B0H16DRAFT_1896903 [Mycena metata]
MFKTKPASRKPDAAQTRPESHPESHSDASKENRPQKRQRLHSQPPTDSFLNPFPQHRPPVLRPDSTLQSDYIRSPENEIEQAYTPQLSPTQLQALGRWGAHPEALKALSTPSSGSMITTPASRATTIASSSRATSLAIDPTLDSFIDSLDDVEPPASKFFSNPPSLPSDTPKSAAAPLMTPFQPPHDPDLSPTLLRPAYIPKAVTDRLNAQEARIRTLEERVDIDMNTITLLKRTKFELNTDIEDLDNENHQMLIRLEEQDEMLETQQTMIDSLVTAVQGLQQGQGQAADVKSGTKKKESRDNAWNLASRKTFFAAMGLPSTSKIKDATIAPVKKCGGYINDPETRSGKLLRPDWAASFSENSNWHPRMIAYMRQKVPSHSPAITKEMMSSKSDADILERIESIFANIRTEYRKTVRGSSGDAKDPAGEEEEDADDDEEDTVDKKKQLNRRSGRKVRKCDERILALESHGVQLQPPYEFFLQPRYQSTDESDAEDVLDPDTDNENEVPAQATRKPWITRTPEYRNDEFHDGVLSVDVLLFKLRNLHTTDNRGKTPAHPRIRGPSKNVPLPFVGANKDNKIPRSVIRPEWLAAHPENDTPSRIQDEDAVGTIADAADAADVVP